MHTQVKKIQWHSSERHAQLLTALPVVACITINKAMIFFSSIITYLRWKPVILKDFFFFFALLRSVCWCHNVWRLLRVECIQPDHCTSDEEHTARDRERVKEIAGKQNRITVLPNDESGNASWQTTACPRVNHVLLVPASLFPSCPIP